MDIYLSVTRRKRVQESTALRCLTTTVGLYGVVAKLSRKKTQIAYKGHMSPALSSSSLPPRASSCLLLYVQLLSTTRLSHSRHVDLVQQDYQNRHHDGSSITKRFLRKRYPWLVLISNTYGRSVFCTGARSHARSCVSAVDKSFAELCLTNPANGAEAESC